MGVLVGLLVLTQTTVNTYSQAEKSEDKKEHSDTDSSQSEQVTISEAVPTSGSQINLGFQSILLQKLVLDEETEGQGSVIEKLVPTTQKALKVLFRKIIAPNAP